jgi:DNA-binding transcriptional regulator LsrR (DeoR family)
VVDIIEIYVHWYAGRSKSEVAASLGVDRKTIRKYLLPAEQSGIVPGGPPMSEADWSKQIKSWFPELADRRLRQVTWPDIDQHRDYIKELLGTVTVSTIHQRLRDEHGLIVSISSFRRWVSATLPKTPARRVGRVGNYVNFSLGKNAIVHTQADSTFFASTFVRSGRNSSRSPRRSRRAARWAS